MSPTSIARVLVFDERFRFDTFVVGDSTRDAVDAAQLVAESPGARWNPLVIRGGAGLGKSHLLGAIGRRARELRPSLHVAAVSAGVDGPIGDMAMSDVLLVDDVRATMTTGRAAELRDAIGAAIAAGRQVVVAEDGSAPISRGEASTWIAQSRRARLVRLGVPNDAARRAIVRGAAATRALALTDDALDALAREPVASVRELLGRLSRVAERSGIAGALVDVGPVAVAGPDDDFASFLDEVAREVASQVEPWRMRVGEAIARWRDDVDVAVLERALRLTRAPDVDALLATFESAVVRLTRVRRRASDVDRSLLDHPSLRDPARVAEAEALVRAAAPRPPMPNAATSAGASSFAMDAEGWMLEWPNVQDLVVETWP